MAASWQNLAPSEKSRIREFPNMAENGKEHTQLVKLLTAATSTKLLTDLSAAAAAQNLIP